MGDEKPDYTYFLCQISFFLCETNMTDMTPHTNARTTMRNPDDTQRHHSGNLFFLCWHTAPRLDLRLE